MFSHAESDYTLYMWVGARVFTLWCLIAPLAVPATERSPHELYDAAHVDGANEWRVFWHVTLPRLRPVMLILVVLRFGSAMAVIDRPTSRVLN